MITRSHRIAGRIYYAGAWVMCCLSLLLIGWPLFAGLAAAAVLVCLGWREHHPKTPGPAPAPTLGGPGKPR